MTVAPLTAAVLAGAERTQAGIASAVNNAVARVAGLIGTAAVGAAIATAFATSLDRNLAGVRLGPAAEATVREAKRLPLGLPDVSGLPPRQAHAVLSAAEAASLHSFHLGLAIAAVLVALGGIAGALGVRNPQRRARLHMRGRGTGRGESGGGVNRYAAERKATRGMWACRIGAGDRCLRSSGPACDRRYM